MSDAVIYLVKSILVSGSLTIYYWLFLRNKKFNRYNRYYLLFVLVAGITIPLLNFRIYSVAQPTNNIAAGFLHAIQSNEVVPHPAQSLWQYLLLIAVCFISCGLLTIFLTQVVKMFMLGKRWPCTSIHGINVYITDLDEAPFSFANNLFWKRGVSMESEEGSLIFNHEMAHIRERHTYDKLFVQLVARLFWMNPFYKLVLRELSIVHEFIADEKSVGNGDTSMFARMLLTTHNAGRYLDLENSFFHSPIKRRLTMIADSGKISCSWLRRICILPVTLAMFFIFSIGISNAQTEPAKNTDSARREKLEAEKKAANPFNEMEPKSHEASEQEVKALFTKIVTNPPEDRIYFINGARASVEKVKRLKYENTKDMLLLPPEDAMKRYGATGSKGIVAFITKK